MTLLSRLKETSDAALHLPLVSKLGGIVIVVGLALDTIVHVFLEHEGEATIAGFSVPEHAAHLVVLVGMILVIGGVMAYGARMSHATAANSSVRRSNAYANKEREDALR